MFSFAFSVILWTGDFVWWVGYYTKWRKNPETWMDCKLNWFLFYTCEHVSCALVVVMTTEKCLALYFPIKTKHVCTVKTAKRLSLLTLLLNVACSAQWLFNAKASQDECGYDYCEIVNVYKGYKRDFEIIKGALYSVVPSTMLIIFSSLIITKLYTAKGQSMGKIAKQGTVMLLLVTFAFIVLTLPVIVHTS